MTETKITAQTILDNKEIREQLKEQVEVLEKVKQLFLIPEMEVMTVKQVADYFEVETETIQMQYKRNKDEFDEDGVCVKTPKNFTSCTFCTTRKTAQTRTFLEITLDDNTIIAIPNCGVKCFPKRAILRMGMLLRDSRVAKEIRTQLLNTFEHATAEQRISAVNEEENLVGNIVRAALNNDAQTTILSLTEYIGYKNRYITEIQQHSAELAKENGEKTAQ